MSLCEDLIEKFFEVLDLLAAERDALAHLLSVGGPLADVVLGFPVVPADELYLLLPALVRLGQAAVSLDDFVFEFSRHFNSPPVARGDLFLYYNTDLRAFQ